MHYRIEEEEREQGPMDCAMQRYSTAELHGTVCYRINDELRIVAIYEHNTISGPSGGFHFLRQGEAVLPRAQ